MPKPKSIPHQSSILDCDGQLVDTHKLTDKDYRRAMQLGLVTMLKSGELNHADVKPDA